MSLEFAIGVTRTEQRYEFELTKRTGKILVADWAGPVRKILRDRKEGVPVPEISARFHNSLVELIVDMARRSGNERVVLSGGCFQNRYLTERSVARLQAEGFRCYWHQRVPPNDGGISLGQIAAGAEILRRG